LLVTSLLIIALASAPLDPIDEYFAGEMRESFVFMGAGAASVGTGLGLLLEHGDVGRPMSVPLLLFGVVELVLGVGLAVRTPGQVRALKADLDRGAEAKRMLGVMNGFQIYRLFELTVATTGAFMAGIGYVRDERMVAGVGLGLLIEAAVLLGLDYFAEERGRKYLVWLTQ
jgi:hypothetical protein